MDVSGAFDVVYRDYNKLLRSVDSAVQNAYLASRQWGAGTFVAMRPVDRQRTLSDEDVFSSIHQSLRMRCFALWRVQNVVTVMGDVSISSDLMPEVQPQNHQRHDALGNVMHNMVTGTGLAYLTDKQNNFSSEQADKP